MNEQKLQEFILKSGKENMDVKAIHTYLSEESYWAKGISYGLVDKALENSFCLGVFIDDRQIAFARLITDYYTFAWLADVYVLDAFRGQGLSKMMMSYIMDQSFSKRLRRIMLNTLDAHGLYRQYGFTELQQPQKLMEFVQPDIHLKYQDA